MMAAKKGLPTFKKKRKIMFNEKGADMQRLQTGIDFMEAGQYYDALEFFARSDAEEQIREIAEIAKQEYNVPVFFRAKIILKEKPTNSELEHMGELAAQKGFPSLAALAYQKAGREEMAAEFRQESLGKETASEEETEPEGGSELTDHEAS